MAQLVTGIRYKGFADDGTPNAGGRLYTYVSGTTTFQSAYVDAGLATPASYTPDGADGQYIELDSRGETQLWIGTAVYTLVEKTPAGVTINTVDGVTATVGGGGGSGTVTSVAMTMPAEFDISGSPVSTTGTLAVTYKTFWNSQTGTSYTLVLGDANKGVSMNNASANTLTVPPYSSVPIPPGRSIVGWQKGVGLTTIVEGSGVTIKKRSPLTFVSAGQDAMWTLIASDVQDTWVLTGDLA